MKWHHWFLVVFGFWLLISPWLLGFSSLNLVVWNNVVMGALIVVLAFWNLPEPKE